jgi:predicted homoserine dehydrogenase-like protein
MPRIVSGPGSAISTRRDGPYENAVELFPFGSNDVFSMFLIYHLVALATLLSCVLDVNATSCKCVSWANDCFATKHDDLR